MHTVISDWRGSTLNPKKLDQALIEAHILSFNPQVSHYKLDNSPNWRYLEPHLTITDMWKDYNLTHEAISYISYQRVFQSMNIGFSKPSQDKCDFCEAKNTIQRKTTNILKRNAPTVSS